MMLLADRHDVISQQARMFQEMDEMIAHGMPVTDAREQAERNHLMLETQF